MLNVIRKSKERELRFGDLQILDIFQFKGDLWIKVRSSLKEENAVNLITGGNWDAKPLSLESETLVELKNATVTIDD